MFGFLKRKKGIAPTNNGDGLGLEHAVTTPMDFDYVIDQFNHLSDRAKATLLYRLVEVMPYKVAHTFHTYLKGRLYGNSDDSRPEKVNSTGSKKASAASKS